MSSGHSNEGTAKRVGELEAIYHPEGRCTPDGSDWQYEYTLRDHLGNSRVTFADLDGSNDVEDRMISDEGGMNVRGTFK